jgi:hypothetical protein
MASSMPIEKGALKIVWFPVTWGFAEKRGILAHLLSLLQGHIILRFPPFVVNNSSFFSKIEPN